jgi:hypothetical protein
MIQGTAQLFNSTVFFESVVQVLVSNEDRCVARLFNQSRSSCDEAGCASIEKVYRPDYLTNLNLLVKRLVVQGLVYQMMARVCHPNRSTNSGLLVRMPAAQVQVCRMKEQAFHLNCSTNPGLRKTLVAPVPHHMAG